MLWALRLCLTPPRTHESAAAPAELASSSFCLRQGLELSSPLGAHRQGLRGLGPPLSTFGSQAASPSRPSSAQSQVPRRGTGAGTCLRPQPFPRVCPASWVWGHMGAADFSRAVLDSSLPTGQACRGRGAPSLLNGRGRRQSCAAPAPSPHDPPGGCSRDGGATRGPATALPGGEGGWAGGHPCSCPQQCPQVSSSAPGSCSRWLALDAETWQPCVHRGGLAG